MNEPFDVINGKGLILHAKMTGHHKSLVSYEIMSVELKKNTKPELHIAISPLKQTDRFEYFVEKATELGVNKITPLLCHRTEKRRINSERIRRITISAMKQSGNAFLPEINDLTDFSTFVSNCNSANRCIAYCGVGEKKALHLLNLNQNTAIAIGPEGDFDEKEIKLASTNGFQVISLTDLTLRTETAAISVSAYFQIRNSA